MGGRKVSKFPGGRGRARCSGDSCRASKELLSTLFSALLDEALVTEDDELISDLWFLFSLSLRSHAVSSTAKNARIKLEYRISTSPKLPNPGESFRVLLRWRHPESADKCEGWHCRLHRPSRQFLRR